MNLPGGLYAPPLAHRGLWSSTGAPENSLAAFDAACTAGYGIELDVRLSAGGEAMVFHDETLERMTGAADALAALTARALGEQALKGGPERIPTLAQTFERIAGRGLVLVELKAVPNPRGELEAAVAAVLDAYSGPAAVISFDAGALAWFAAHLPDVPRGLDAAGFADEDLADSAGDLEGGLAALIEHARPHFLVLQLQTALGRLAARYRANGLPVLAWTVRSAADAATVAKGADNFIFEGFAA